MTVLALPRSHWTLIFPIFLTLTIKISCSISIFTILLLLGSRTFKLCQVLRTSQMLLLFRILLFTVLILQLLLLRHLRPLIHRKSVLTRQPLPQYCRPIPLTHLLGLTTQIRNLSTLALWLFGILELQSIPKCAARLQFQRCHLSSFPKR